MIGVAALIVGAGAYVLIVFVGDQMWVGARPTPLERRRVAHARSPGFARAVADMYDERAADDNPLVLPADR